ncbi:hypothetical protein MJM83_31235, partial [Salmonella enterica subsp. enterica serovar Montevideo]|nr:hypothetical protein [Salmonella enterica subsp. enterica serovar Montevideo]
AAVQVRLHGSAPARVKKGHEQCQTSLRWHYPDQVVRVFLSLHMKRVRWDENGMPDFGVPPADTI